MKVTSHISSHISSQSLYIEECECTEIILLLDELPSHDNTSSIAGPAPELPTVHLLSSQGMRMRGSKTQCSDRDHACDATFIDNSPTRSHYVLKKVKE